MATTEIPKALGPDPGAEICPPIAYDHANGSGGAAWLLSRWWIAFAASSIAVVSGHLLIKAGLNALPPALASAGLFTRVVREVLQPQVFAGLLIYLAGTVCWMKAVSQEEISFLYPLSSVNYVLVAAISALALHESISVRRSAGVAVIVVGMILMIRQPRRKKS